MKNFTETIWYSLSKLCICVSTYKNTFQLAVATLNIDNTEMHDIVNDEIHYIKNKCLLDLIKPIADNIGYLEKNSSTLTDVFYSILDIHIKIEAAIISKDYISLKTESIKIIFKIFLSLY